MQLEMLLRDIKTKAVSGSTDLEADNLCYDSRRVSKGSVFFALRGECTDGHRFIDGAIECGAVAVIAEEKARTGMGATWIEVENSRVAMAEAAKTFYGDPAASMGVAAITGTNGKTTTAFLLHHLLVETWKRCGLVGTVTNDTGVEQVPAERTTPESLDLQFLLARMRDEGCRGAVMEVSSHGLIQERVRELSFDVAVFTNLSQDHLDYHGTLEKYFAAKEKLFEGLLVQGGSKKPVIVVNTDDRFGRRLVERFGEELPVISFGLGVACDFRAVDVRSEFSGTTFKLEAKRRSSLVRLPLVGRFNVYNALAALAAGSALGINLRESIVNIANAPQVPGRLQSVGERKAFRVFVDYAHTPDAIENVLEAVRQLSPRRIITVFGCGGDRDRDKRPLMGRAAERLSDVVIVTSDNPRGEEPDRIIKDIERGMTASRHEVIPDRREAINSAIMMAGERDIVVLAGKGHEDYQEIRGTKHPFDDAVVALYCIADRGREES